MSARLRRQGAILTAAGLTIVGLAAAPSSAVNADQGATVVSAAPATFTPHVMNGSVNAITQVGNKIIAAGTFTTVSRPDLRTSANITRNRIFAFDATTGVIDTSFNPNLSGAANSLDTDGTIHLRRRRRSARSAGTPRSSGSSSSRAAGAVGPRLQGGAEQRGQRGRRAAAAGSTSVAPSPASSRAPSRRPAARSPPWTPRTGAVARRRSTCRSPASTTRPPTAAGPRTSSGSTSPRTAPSSSRSATSRPSAACPVADRDARHRRRRRPRSRRWSTDRYDRAHNSLRQRLRHLHPRRRLLARRLVLRRLGHRRLRRRRGSGTMCDTTSRWETNSTGRRRRPGPTTPAATRPTASRSPAPRSTSAATCAGRTTPSRATRPAPAPCPRGHRRPRPGQRPAAVVEPRPHPRRRRPGALRHLARACGSAATPPRSAASTHGRIALMPLAGGTTIPDGRAAQRCPTTSSSPSAPAAPAATSSTASTPAARRAGLGQRPRLDRRRRLRQRRQHRRLGHHGAPRRHRSGQHACRTSSPRERWGSQDWNFPVTPGDHVTVRLYFANQYDGTAQAGQRVFNVLRRRQHRAARPLRHRRHGRQQDRRR